MDALKLPSASLGSFLISVIVAVFPFSSRACDRDCVLDIVDNYVNALVAHNPSAVNFADQVRSTENGSDTTIGEGIWQSITGTEGYRQVLVDDGLRSAVFYGAFEESGEPLLLAIRFGLEEESIAEVEHLVSRYDDRNTLISRHQLTGPNPVYEQVQAPENRLSRQQLVAAANAYFDGIANNTNDGVPMHRECSRRENGVLLLRNPNPATAPCPIGFERFNYIVDVRDRRVAVVDQTRNLVLMWAFFDVPGNIEVTPRSSGPSDLASSDGTPRVDTRRIPRSLYLAELFRLQDGQIRDIEAIMFNMDLGARSGWE